MRHNRTGRPVMGSSEGGAWRHWELHDGEAAAADSEDTAGSEANDRCCVARLARGEGGRIARATAITQAGLFPYHQHETVKVFQHQLHREHVENWIL